MRLDYRQGEQLHLPSGFTILVRPISIADGSLLLEGFGRLSVRSRHLRFMGGKNVLTAADVRYLTDVDHHDHEAVVALDPAGRGVGVTRFVRDPCRRNSAEVAIVVVDEWQRRGVGRRLLSALAERADAEGITCFTGLMADDNTGVVALLRSAGAVLTVTERDVGAVRFTTPVASLLDDPQVADQLVIAPCCA
jgi:GNAT superfamily N-acetyltransferase